MPKLVDLFCHVLCFYMDCTRPMKMVDNSPSLRNHISELDTHVSRLIQHTVFKTVLLHLR